MPKTISFSEFWSDLKYTINGYYDEKNQMNIIPKTMGPFIETLSLLFTKTWSRQQTS